MSFSGSEHSGGASESRFGLVQIWNEGERLRHISTKEVWLHFTEQAFRSMAKSPITTIFSVLTISVALFLLGGFFFTLENVGDAIQGTRSEVRIRVFLKDNVTDVQRENVTAEIQKFPGVGEVAYIDQAMALTEFGEALGDQSYLVKGLESDNPLPASLDVKFGIQHATTSRFDDFASQVSALEGVDRVNYSRGLIGQLGQVLSYFRLAGSFGVFVMLLVTGFIIASTIRLALYSQRDELEIMRLVGATEKFVQAPCLIEGGLHGLCGAILGTMTLYLFYRAVTKLVTHDELQIFGLSAPHFLSFSSLAIVFLCGVAVGVIGSFIAVKRFKDA